MINRQILEKWTQKYKKSIDCSNPKGFSQRAHCQGRKKKLHEDLRRWFKEKWTAQDGSKCGEYKGRGRVKCRPSRRVSDKSPQTWGEMSKEEKKKAVRKKQEAHRKGKQWSSHKSGKTWDGPKNKYRPKNRKMDESYLIEDDVIATGENPTEYRGRLLRQIANGNISSMDNHDRVHGALAYIDSIRDHYTGPQRNINLVVRAPGNKKGVIGYSVLSITGGGTHAVVTPMAMGSAHKKQEQLPIKQILGLQLSSYPHLKPEHRETLRRLMDFRGINEMKEYIKQLFLERRNNKDCGCNSSINEEKEKKPYKGFKKGKNHPEGGLSRSEARRQGIHAGIETKDEAKRKGGFGKLSKKTQSRRKSFCARMCGMKKRRTSAKTARDPKSKINAALRVWGCRCGTNESYEGNGEYLTEGKNKPSNSKLWSRAKALARQKFDVYPCVPLDSLAISKEGPINHEDLKIGQEILTYNIKEDKLQWKPVINKHYYENAPLMEIGKPTGFSIRCTPNHKWVVSRKNERELVETKDLNTHMNIVMCSTMDNESSYLSENWSKKDNWIPKILTMNKNEREIFLASSIVYDGWDKGLSTKIKDRHTLGFSQKEYDHLWSSMLSAYLNGYYVKFNEKEDITSVTYIRNKKHHSTQNLYKKQIENEDVWCPTTENETWVMVQNGLITITGNSAYANAWAAKWYKKHGGKWRSTLSENLHTLNEESYENLLNEAKSYILENYSLEEAVTLTEEQIINELWGGRGLLNRIGTDVNLQKQLGSLAAGQAMKNPGARELFARDVRASLASEKGVKGFLTRAMPTLVGKFREKRREEALKMLGSDEKQGKEGSSHMANVVRGYAGAMIKRKAANLLGNVQGRVMGAVSPEEKSKRIDIARKISDVTDKFIGSERVSTEPRRPTSTELAAQIHQVDPNQPVLRHFEMPDKFRTLPKSEKTSQSTEVIRNYLNQRRKGFAKRLRKNLDSSDIDSLMMSGESYSPMYEEIVNPRNAGTMTEKEKIKRDNLAKRLKNVKAIKGNDSEKNAKYRYATYLILKARGGGKTKKSEKSETKKSNKKKKKKSSK